MRKHGQCITVSRSCTKAVHVPGMSWQLYFYSECHIQQPPPFSICNYFCVQVWQFSNISCLFHLSTFITTLSLKYHDEMKSACSFIYQIWNYHHDDSLIIDKQFTLIKVLPWNMVWNHFHFISCPIEYVECFCWSSILSRQTILSSCFRKFFLRVSLFNPLVGKTWFLLIEKHFLFCKLNR